VTLLNATPVLYLLRGFRVAHFAGRFGSGKTASAYRLAYELCEGHGFRYILSNCADVWSDRPQDIALRPNERGEPQYMDAVLIIDEAGLVFEGTGHAKQFISFMRKFNVVLLLPSFEAPPARVRFLQIQRKYNLAALGLPLWWYEARLNTGLDRQRYQFGWWGFSEIFGIYDTGDFPADDDGIGDWIQTHVEAKTGRHRRAGRRQGDAAGDVPPLAPAGGDAAPFADAAEEISDAVSLLVEWQDHPRKRRR